MSAMTMVSVRTGRQPWRADGVLVAIVFAGLVLWPVYVLPPGYPQPVSLALTLAFAWVAVRGTPALMVALRTPEMILISAFCAYVLLVNTIVAIANQNVEPLWHSLFYWQVAMACAVVQYLLQTESRAAAALYWGIVASMAVQAGLMLLLGTTDSPRASALFGNPNQLAFYSLLSLGVLMALFQHLAMPRWSILVGVSLALALLMVSLSKAAIIAAIAQLVLYGAIAPARREWLRRLRPLTALIVPTVIVVAVILYREQIELIGAVLDRLGEIGRSSDDTFEGRGYARIVQWPEYLIFGAGEGILHRWSQSFELHSMFGTLLFSYGLPGLALFLALLALLARRNLRNFAIYMTPILLYSLTHQPMRQWMMWCLFLVLAWLGSMPSGRLVKRGAAQAAAARDRSPQPSSR